MSIHEMDNAEILAEIQKLTYRNARHFTWYAWSFVIIPVGIILVIIGESNYETSFWVDEWSPWGFVILVGVVIGIVGVSIYVSTRNDIQEVRTEIAVLAATFEDRSVFVSTRNKILQVETEIAVLAATFEDSTLTISTRNKIREIQTNIAVATAIAEDRWNRD